MYPKSEAAFAKASAVIPGGVNSPVRAFKAVNAKPIFIEKGEGALLFDVDGNEYVDYIGSWGPHLLGHAHPAIIEAVVEAAKRSTSFGAPTIAETTLAELLVEALPSVDQVRLVNSGTEAAMSAIRLARGFTGRDLIIKFAGCYHGHADCMLIAAGSGALTHGKPSSAGVPAGTVADTIVLPYNDLAAVEEAFKLHGTKIAGIILEPVAGNMGCIVPQRGYLEGLRAITEKHGSMLIFDEVMTGFRVAWGGAQRVFEITPDITVLGKVIGGGMPLAAFGARQEIMDCLSPVGSVYQAGTLSGNPVATAAGYAALSTIKADPKFYDRLEVLGARLAHGLEEAAREVEIDAHITRFGSMITIFFRKGPVLNVDDANASDMDRFGRFHAEMLKRGVYLPPAQYEAWFISGAHTFEMIDATIAAAKDALQVVKKN